jgi:hypothetical protein
MWSGAIQHGIPRDVSSRYTAPAAPLSCDEWLMNTRPVFAAAGGAAGDEGPAGALSMASQNIDAPRARQSSAPPLAPSILPAASLRSLHRVNTALSTLFDHSVDFDPAADAPAFLKSVPAKWVVYLLADADDRPIQLLCVRNLRYSLERRLVTPEETRSKRVNYREFVRRVHWRRVDSSFEADVLYWDAARALFPNTYKGLMAFRQAWFVHVDPDAEFPRYVRTNDPSAPNGVTIGPLEDKHDAQKLIQLAEDTFDLCRYYHILTEAPRGKACAYKEMGRCAAPCDGTVPMWDYRGTVADSQRAVVDPQSVIAAETRRMQAAAAALRFEEAAKIKARIAQLSQFGVGKFRHARRIQDFQFLSLQRGPSDGTAKVFLVTPAGIEEVAGLIAEPKVGLSDLLRHILSLAAKRATIPLDASSAERIGLVAHHLFLPKQTHGLFLRITDVSGDKEVARAYRELRKQKPEEAQAGVGTEAGEGSSGGSELTSSADARADEGVVRELEPDFSPQFPAPPPPQDA